jgi:hypothetical protein
MDVRLDSQLALSEALHGGECWHRHVAIAENRNGSIKGGRVMQPCQAARNQSIAGNSAIGLF